MDHLFYITAMLFLVTRWRRILTTMSAFTASHSLTRSAAALGWVRVPQPPVEAYIAVCIVFVAAVLGLAAMLTRIPMHALPSPLNDPASFDSASPKLV